MTERITDHDEIREVVNEIRNQTGRDFTPEQMQQEFQINDLNVSLSDLTAAVDFGD